MFKFVVAIVGGAGVGVTVAVSESLLEAELARRHGGGVAGGRVTDTDRRHGLFRRFWLDSASVS